MINLSIKEDCIFDLVDIIKEDFGTSHYYLAKETDVDSMTQIYEDEF